MLINAMNASAAKTVDGKYRDTFIDDDLLRCTAIVTTSFIQSHPATEMIDQVIASIPDCSFDGRDSCGGGGSQGSSSYDFLRHRSMHVMIICDGFKHIKGSTNETDLEGRSRYRAYIANLQQKYAETDTEIIIRDRNLGYAKNLEYCLNRVRTKYVLVVQHDQLFTRKFNLSNVVRCLESHSSDVNYIGFPSITNCDEVRKRLILPNFRRFTAQWLNEMAARAESEGIGEGEGIKEARGGGGGEENGEGGIKDGKELEKEIKPPESLHHQGCTEAIIGSESGHQEVSKNILNFSRKAFGLPLMPLVFFYDKPHCMKTSEYLLLFKNYTIKQFPEMSIGHIWRDDISKEGLSAFRKYRAYLLYDQYLNPLITHVHGRAFLTESALRGKQQYVPSSAKTRPPADDVADNIDYTDDIYDAKEVKLKVEIVTEVMKDEGKG